MHYFLSAKQRAPEPGTGESRKCAAGAMLISRLPRAEMVGSSLFQPYPTAGQPSLTNKDLMEECLGSVLLAVAVVMAGSGHLPTFKLLRGGPASGMSQGRCMHCPW